MICSVNKLDPILLTAALILSTCADLSVMIQCKEVHCYILRQGLEDIVLACNSQIATYSKCGDINSSLTICKKMPESILKLMLMHIN